MEHKITLGERRRQFLTFAAVKRKVIPEMFYELLY